MSTPLTLATIHQFPSMTDPCLRRIMTAGLVDTYPRWTAAVLAAAGIPADRAGRLARETTGAQPDQTAATLQRLHIHVVAMDDQRYPRLLSQIHSVPPVLYVRGSVEALHRPAVAIVGTRFPSAYGLMATAKLTRPVAAAGVTIVSGLAIGVDAAAHQDTLESKGATVAVFGTGIDRLYPAHHRMLAEAILAGGGALVSEFPLGTGVAREHFPRRNRIISGLASATLIIEAGERSGALITAKFAVEQNRELLALPGPIDAPTSVGPNNWIRLGATLVRSAEDILELYALAAPKEMVTPVIFANKDEATLFAWLGSKPVHIDALTEKSRLDSSLVSATLSLMEIRGLVRHVGGQFYCRAA